MRACSPATPTQAEHIVADAFTKVYVRWKKGGLRDIGAYLRRALANEANSKLRRRYLERREASKRSGDDRGVRLVDDHAADHDLVWQAIQRLPDRQRQAVVLRYYEDLSEADTAEILGCPVGSVKSQVSRGLARMQELLAASGLSTASDGRCSLMDRVEELIRASLTARANDVEPTPALWLEVDRRKLGDKLPDGFFPEEGIPDVWMRDIGDTVLVGMSNTGRAYFLGPDDTWVRVGGDGIMDGDVVD